VGLIKKIKEKKELSGVSDSIVKDNLDKVLKKYNVSSEYLTPKNEKIILKEVRSLLRDQVGQFQTSIKSRSKFLDDKNQLLKTHSSTKERLTFYPELIKIIKNLKVKSILDLGCGLNPVALANKEVKYFASDINEEEISIINRYFKKKKIRGHAFIYDLKKINKDLPKADLCLLFKILETVDDDHKLTKKILLLVQCDKILVSFSSKKLSGKSMDNPNRSWFEILISKMNFKVKKFHSDNEIFYLLGRN